MTATYWTKKGESGGYEMARGNAEDDSEEWINTPAVPIHRLAAVAWYGFDAVEDADVHHRLPIPWLNVESNLLPLPSPEHSHLTAKLKYSGGIQSVPQSIIDDVTAEFGGGEDG